MAFLKSLFGTLGTDWQRTQWSTVSEHKSPPEVPYHCPIVHILLPHSSFALLVSNQRGLRELKWLSGITYPPFAQVGLGSLFLLWKLCISFPLRWSIHSASHFLLSQSKCSSMWTGRPQISELSRRKRMWWEFYYYTDAFKMQKTWILTILNELQNSGKVYLGNAFWLWKEVQKQLCALSSKKYQLTHKYFWYFFYICSLQYSVLLVPSNSLCPMQIYLSSNRCTWVEGIYRTFTFFLPLFISKHCYHQEHQSFIQQSNYWVWNKKIKYISLGFSK